MATAVERPLSSLEHAILGVSLQEAPGLAPGLLAAAAVAWLGTVLARWLGTRVLGMAQSPVSPIMVAIVLGMVAANAAPLPRVLQPGIRFCLRKLLRFGIILLGIRLSLLDVMQIGVYGIPAVLLCIATGLAVTSALTHWLRLPERLGTLIAVGTSICGLSAIVATAPAIDASDEEVAYAAANITIFGAIATFLYPYLAQVLFGSDPVRAGLFLGTAVHDTSQVTAAALIFDQVVRPLGHSSATDVAVVTKLVRNVFMAAVVPLMAYRYARGQARAGGGKVNVRRLLPVFVLGFIAVAVFRSVGDATLRGTGTALSVWDAAGWHGLTAGTKALAENLLLLSLAGLGLSTNFGFLRRLGAKPFLAGMAAALVVGVAGALAAYLIGPLIVL